MKLNAKQIRDNLRAGKLPDSIQLPDATEARQLSEQELEHHANQASKGDQNATLALMNHAAWFIQKNLPNARFPHHPENPQLPTGSTVRHLATHWPLAFSSSDILPQPLKPLTAEKSAGRSATFPTPKRTPAYGT